MKKFVEWLKLRENGMMATHGDIVQKANQVSNPQTATKNVQDTVKKITGDPKNVTAFNSIKTAPTQAQAMKTAGDLATNTIKANNGNQVDVMPDQVSRVLFQQATGKDMPNPSWINK